jgi:hypothetical protein
MWASRWARSAPERKPWLHSWADEEQPSIRIREAETHERLIPDAYRRDQKEREAMLRGQSDLFRKLAAGLEAGAAFLEAKYPGDAPVTAPQAPAPVPASAPAPAPVPTVKR